MKHLTLFIYLCTFSLFTQVASADSYWGVKATTVNVDSSAYSDTINVGALIGADFTQIGSNTVALEGELTETLIQGKVSGVNWNIQTFALYAAMRTGSENYLKLKAGYLSSTIKISGFGSTTDGSGFSYGIGYGFNDYEIEYTITNGKGNNKLSMISLAYLF